MRLDSEGNIIAAAGWELGGPGPLIYVFSSSGEVLETHPVPCRRPTNCAFGGEGLSGTGPKAGGPHYLLRFCAERTLTINTAAAGGNVELAAGLAS